jgi:hypothetical protein
VSSPKVPPHIQKQIAALGKTAPPPGAPRAAPGAGPAAPGKAAAPAAPKAPAKPGSVMAKVAAVGWVVAVAAIGIAVAEYQLFDSQKQAALDEQAATFNAQIAQLKADAAAALKKVQDDAAATQMSIQTELDFQKMPEIPLETTFRANQVLYVESRLDEAFSCKVRLFRPIGGVTREVDFTMKARTFQDLAAIDTWLFQKGDKVEFIKSGFKPRSLIVP